MKLRNAIAAGLIATSATFGIATATAAETAPASETTAATTTEAPAAASGSADGLVSGSSDKLEALSSEVSVDSITGVFNTLGSLAQSILGLVTAIVGK
ncbi:hypothetical protein L1O03_00060 [Corynebacterium uropygiale]|uniref:Secreted protein n=1 Tax=Corynebacterium uropygiale TaxID=1775911 RepID=A0A9X1QR98_9CORY|nr:hypothetical protein [Corynebacterium uropygiale]MCF4005580.1 hypothetical protein [Corynebacterium uropygiale]